MYKSVIAIINAYLLYCIKFSSKNMGNLHDGTSTLKSKALQYTAITSLMRWVLQSYLNGHLNCCASHTSKNTARNLKTLQINCESFYSLRSFL